MISVTVRTFEFGKCLALGLGAVLVCSLVSVAQAQEAPAEETTSGSVLEEITVTGVRSSIERSIDDKRMATEIKDSISAEDIGQLPDQNIAEALQRVTGVQMGRNADGEGDTLQIRGMNDNNVELNGQTMSGTGQQVSGASSNRSINFQDIPSELFSGIEVLKAPTADSVEGSLGGTVNLKTRRPLNGKKEMVASLTAKLTYADIADEYDPDLNAFFLKQFNDTGLGDFGLILNLGRKSVTSVNEVYGGGDFDDAPAIWVRLNSGQTLPFGSNFSRPDRAGQWIYDLRGEPAGCNLNSTNVAQGGCSNRYIDVDVNGDGVADANDVFYVPNRFGFFENTRTSDRNSLNATLQWQPSDRTNFFLDFTATDIEETLTGSSYSVNFNVARGAPLEAGNNVYESLGNTRDLGEVFLMTSGLMGGATTRLGGLMNNEIERESTQATLGGDVQFTERFSVAAEVSTSDGEWRTIDQGSLVSGPNFDCNLFLDANDFAGVVGFQLPKGSRVPDATLYESPFAFNSACWGITQIATDLVEIDPTDASYERLSYFQFNRVANNTENTADSFRIDGNLELADSGITKLTFGWRSAERSYDRRQWENPNQGGGANPSTLWDGVRDPAEALHVQRIYVNPATNADPDIAAASAFLQECQRSAGYNGLLASEGGDLARTWTSNGGCTGAEISDAFNMIDIRAVEPNTGGVGYYEETGNRFGIEERTDAAYLMADFRTDVGNMELYGNVGTRYVRTVTESTGWVQDENSLFDLTTFYGEYSDYLTSLNLNLALNDEMILRLGISQSLGRPGLNIISPSIDINRNDQVEGFNGNGTAGNPDVDPVRSNNIDLSFEWYYGSASLLSIAYFHKDIDSTIILDSEQVPFQIGNELFLIRTYDNFPGTKIDGLEFGLQHAFDSLPGIWSNTGVQLNYTFTDEDSDLIDQEGDPIPRERLSDSSYNIVTYYDDGRLNARLAYNWRDDFVRRPDVSLGFGSAEVLPEFEKARGQLDFALNYSITDSLKLNFSAVNLNDSKTVRYMKYPSLVNYIAFAGVRYNMGFVYRFE